MNIEQKLKELSALNTYERLMDALHTITDQPPEQIKEGLDHLGMGLAHLVRGMNILTTNPVICMESLLPKLALGQGPGPEIVAEFMARLTESGFSAGHSVILYKHIMDIAKIFLPILAASAEAADKELCAAYERANAAPRPSTETPT